MKVFFSLPKPGEGEAFFTRYASLIPTTSFLSYLAQIVSALTEFGILYALLYSYAVDLLPERAWHIAVAGATLGTAFIEIGLRKFTPFAVRAILYKRLRGLDGWMSTFSICTCITLLACSGLLSFKGSKATVSSVTPPPEKLTSVAVDTTHRAVIARVEAAQADELEQLRKDYAEWIKVSQEATAATVARHELTASNYTDREARTGEVYATAKARALAAAAEIRAEGERNVATLHSQLAAAIERVRARYNNMVMDADIERRASIAEIEEHNTLATEKHEATISKYGGGLAYFTLVCLAVFIICIAVEEIHRKGSGIEEQIEPSAFAFEPGLIAAWMGALTEKILTKGYNFISKIEENTDQALEPVAPPVLWSRQQSSIVRTVSERGRLRSGGNQEEGSASIFTEADKVDLSGTAMGLLKQYIDLDRENHEREAEEVLLKADQVLRQYLGPEAIPEAVGTLRQACIDHLNGVGPNPFARHHRQQIGFHRQEKTTAPKPTSNDKNDGPITTVVNDPTAQVTERVVYVDKNSKPCAYCGELFLPKQHNHKYCKTECRLSDHAAKHGGKMYKPNYKAWKDGK